MKTKSRLFHLESCCISCGRTCIGKSRHHFADVHLDVLCCIIEVIVDYIVWIQTEVIGNLWLLGIVQNEELIRTILLGDVHAFRAECKLNPELGCVQMLCTLEHCRGSDFTCGSAGRNAKSDICISIVNNLCDDIMKESQSDDTLACSDVL